MAHMYCINGVTVAVYFNSILAAVHFNFFEKCYKSFGTFYHKRVLAMHSASVRSGIEPRPSRELCSAKDSGSN